MIINRSGQIFQLANLINPGTIVRPFLGDDRFDVTEVEHTPQGSVILRDTWRGRMVEMAAENGVEILGHFNID